MHREEMDNASTYKVTDVTFRGKKVPPVIAYFANGKLSRSASAKAECGIYGFRENPDKYSVAVSCDDILYTAERAPQGPFRTLLAIQDRGSNKVRMVEVEKVCLHPRHLQSGTQAPVLLGNKTRGDLYKTFGSKQIKRRTEQQERMKINVDSIADQLKEAAERANLNTTNTSDDTDYNFSHVPCNRNATNIVDVYNVEDIITFRELDSLEDEAESALACTKAGRAEKYSEFFCEMMDILPADNKLYRTKILLFAECIVWFMKISPAELSKKNGIVCPVSEVINKKILNDFTQESDKGKRLRPVAMKDKALCYAIVASLIAMKFAFDLTSLSSATKVSLNKLLELARHLGALPRKDKKSVIVLKLPLPPPRIPLSRKRKR